MTILKDFYTINSCSKTDTGNYIAKISLNPNHEIFKGHFPGNPVTPGVCMMQIIKDITEKITEQSLILTSASNIKFMAIINPEESPNLDLEISITELDEEIKVKNTTFFGETVALKMAVNYKIVRS